MVRFHTKANFSRFPEKYGFILFLKETEFFLRGEL